MHGWRRYGVDSTGIKRLLAQGPSASRSWRSLVAEDAHGDVVVYGASGHGLAVADMLRRQNGRRVVAFLDDTPEKIGTKLVGIPVVSFSDWSGAFSGIDCFVSSGNAKTRRALVARLSDAGARFTTSVFDGAAGALGFEVGTGSGVWGPLYCGPNVRIGDHVQVMPMTSLGHDIAVEDFATICPGCTVSGHVQIEEGAFVGAGSIVINGSALRPLVIGRNAVVGAGSFVSKNVPPDARVSGNPARPLRELARNRG